MKSLRSSGVSTAARTARRSSRLPPNRRSSVSTLIAAAPPAAYCRASAAGSAISARSPLLGLRRFTSAITLEPGAAQVRHRVARRVDVGQRRAQVGLAGLRPAVARGRSRTPATMSSSTDMRHLLSWLVVWTFAGIKSVIGV